MIAVLLPLTGPLRGRAARPADGPPDSPLTAAGRLSERPATLAAMSRRGWALFVALSIIWGVPYLFIKIAVEDLSPAAVVFARTLLAALLLLPLAAARGQLRPLVPAWPWLLLFALLEVCAPFGLLTVAEQHISSSLTGLLVAAVPLIQALFSRVVGHGRPHRPGGALVGLLVGFAGVAALVGIDVRGGSCSPPARFCWRLPATRPARCVATLKLSHLPSIAVSGGRDGAVRAGLRAVRRGLQDGVADVGASAWAAVAVAGCAVQRGRLPGLLRLLAEVGPSRTTVHHVRQPRALRCCWRPDPRRAGHGGLLWSGSRSCSSARTWRGRPFRRPRA